jgi:hypothetical protein
MNIKHFNILKKLYKVYNLRNLAILSPPSFATSNAKPNQFSKVVETPITSNLHKYVYMFIAPVNVTPRISLNARRTLILNRRQNNYVITISKFINSIKKFLIFIEYTFRQRLSFLTLSSKLYRTLAFMLTSITKSDYLQVFSTVSPRSFYDRVGLTRYRASILKALNRANISTIFLLNQDSYTQLVRTLAFKGFFLIGLAGTNSMLRYLSISIPINKVGSTT